MGTRASISRTLVAQGSTGPGRALPLEVSPAWRIERVVWDAYHRVIRLKWSRTRSVAAQRQAHETHARDAQDMWTWSHVPTETTRAHGTPHWSDTPRDLPPLTHQRTARRSRRHSPATAPKRPRPTPTLHVHGHGKVLSEHKSKDIAPTHTAALPASDAASHATVCPGRPPPAFPRSRRRHSAPQRASSRSDLALTRGRARPHAGRAPAPQPTIGAPPAAAQTAYVRRMPPNSRRQ